MSAIATERTSVDIESADSVGVCPSPDVSAGLHAARHSAAANVAVTSILVAMVASFYVGMKGQSSEDTTYSYNVL